MTYYTIELNDGFTTWIVKYANNSIAKFNTFEEAYKEAEMLLKQNDIKKYHINKFEQEVVRIKDKESSIPKKECTKIKDKTVYKIQKTCFIPYKWIDTDLEFTNQIHAELIVEHQRKEWPDTSYRLVERHYFYEEQVVI